MKKLFMSMLLIAALSPIAMAGDTPGPPAPPPNGSSISTPIIVAVILAVIR